jgi:4-oxalocrotonate tautomerase
VNFVSKNISSYLEFCFFQGEILPVVIVEMWAGRTEEQKERLIKGITRAFEVVGVKPERPDIIIHDVPKSNWGVGGEQASKLSL